VALVNKYDSDFKELNEYLADIDNAALHRRASTSIFKITKNFTLVETDSEQLHLEQCGTDLKRNDKHAAFDYQFLMPLTDPKVKIMKAESFRFWNRTSLDKYCWMKYSGPRYVMVNTTNSCQMDVQEYWIDSKGVSSHPCIKENRPLEQISNLYHPDICRDSFTGSDKDIQIKHYNGLYKVYCFGNNITVSNQMLSCPDYVFDLPLSERFELNGETHDLGEVSTVTVNAVELHINNQLAEQLKTDKIKIYGSNLTTLDSAFERLSRLTSSITGNVRQIDSPIGNWLFDTIKTPMKWVQGLMDKFSTTITIVLAIAAFLVLFPIIEVGLIVWKLGYKAFSALASPMHRLSRRWQSVSARQISSNHVRRYLRRLQ
jgi:hypothetical protein